MDFSIIIVSYNVREQLRANLKALEASIGDTIYEVLVIDNASTDKTVEMIQREFPAITIIANQENKGFSFASNQGLRQIQADYAILLNPDMKILPSTLPHLKIWLISNPQADVTGITLRDEQSHLIKHVRRFPTWFNQLAIILKIPHVLPIVLNRYLMKDFDYSKASVVDSIRGAFFVIKRSALERFGYLDERYFLWFEEVDYCRRIREQGGQVWYTPAAEAIDYVGQSFIQLPRKQKQAYFRHSMIAYFKKWHPWWQVWLLSVGWSIAQVIVTLGDLIKLKSRTKT